MSLRYTANRTCARCHSRALARTDAAPGETYVGSLCKRGHDYQGSGGSLRYVAGQTCVRCARRSSARFRVEQPDAARAQSRRSYRLWAQRHPQKAASYVRRYQQSERARTTRAAWYAATREARLAYRRLANRRRHARRHGVVRVRYTLDDVAALFSLYDGRCAYCGKVASEVDHVVPLSRQGHDALYNFVPACRSCNARKHDALLEDWYPRQSFFALERLQFMAEQHIAAGLPPLNDMC